MKDTNLMQQLADAEDELAEAVENLTELLRDKESDCARLLWLNTHLHEANKQLQGKVARLSRPKLLPRLRTFLKRRFHFEERP